MKENNLFSGKLFLCGNRYIDNSFGILNHHALYQVDQIISWSLYNAVSKIPKCFQFSIGLDIIITKLIDRHQLTVICYCLIIHFFPLKKSDILRNKFYISVILPLVCTERGNCPDVNFSIPVLTREISHKLTSLLIWVLKPT